MSNVRAVIRVPGSTTKVGAGFDCVGIAVNRTLTISARRAASDRNTHALVRTGTLEDIGVDVNNDLVVVGFRAACERAGKDLPWVELRAHSDIPIGRGLGASAAALVAGAAAANTLLNLALDDAALVDLVAEIEGRPENAAAAVYGGVVLAVRSYAGRMVRQLQVAPSIAFVFAVPPGAAPRASAQLAIEEIGRYRDGVQAASKAAALIDGLANADASLLPYALDDALHVPVRADRVPAHRRVAKAAIDAGAYGATLTRSGFAIVAICPREGVEGVEQAMQDAWKAAGIEGDCFSALNPVNGYHVSVRTECEPAETT